MMHEGNLDIIVAFIPSRIQDEVLRVSVIVRSDHLEFNLTWLKVASIIRLDKVCTLLEELVVGEIGGNQ